MAAQLTLGSAADGIEVQDQSKEALAMQITYQKRIGPDGEPQC